MRDTYLKNYHLINALLLDLQFINLLFFETSRNPNN